ncbi:MAG TPA: hypothetical protein VK390_16150 [Propionibacteriaceae bacterium]|nr:hypothetical protein [Propionibacteriaceae bacterium]
MPGFDVGREPRGVGFAAFGLRTFVVSCALPVVRAAGACVLVRAADVIAVFGATPFTVGPGAASVGWNVIDGRNVIDG